MRRPGFFFSGAVMLSGLMGGLGWRHMAALEAPPTVEHPFALAPLVDPEPAVRADAGHDTRAPQRLASKPPSATTSPSDDSDRTTPEIDLELDSSDKVLETLVKRPRALEEARANGSDLLFAYGYALKRSGQHSQALQPLLTYHGNKGRLSTYAALLLGEAMLELKQADEALRWLGEAQSGFPSGERQVQARYAMARAMLLKGDDVQAAKDLQALLNDAPRSVLRHEIRLRLARALEKSNQLDQAITHYEWLWAWVPASNEAEAAGREMNRLQEARAGSYTGPNTAVRYRRALRLLESGQVEPGLSLLLALAQDRAVAATLPRTFTFELARAYFQAKQYSEAAEHLDSWYGRTRTPTERAEALFWRALTQGRLARFDEAIALYRQLAREYPKTRRAETGMYKIGLLRLDQGEYAAAEEAFDAYRIRYPKATQADNAVWYVAWAQLRQGRFTAAQASFDELLRKYPRTSLTPGVRYWQGRMALEQKNRDQAISYFRMTLQSPIASHYAPMAEKQLSMLGVALEMPPAQPPRLEGGPTLALPHPELLERMNALLSLGLRTWAQEELSAYQHNLKGRDDYLALAQWYRKVGNYGGARLVMANLGLGEGVPRLRDAGLTWQLSYPLAFRAQLKQVTLPKKVPIELVYAIMRQESEFRPWVTSSAGARGLMQVMPETAAEVSQLRKMTPPLPNTLYRPDVCVQYGAWHLDDLMKRLGGRLPLVIAAYNGSPEAVERWMKDKPVDPIDVFIEEISYSETRRYVKKVLTNLWIYRRLYADGRTPLMNEPGFEKAIVARKVPKRPPEPVLEQAAAKGAEALEEEESAASP